MKSPLSGEKIVGLTAGLTPYHHARWQAFSERVHHACVVLELTNKDEFPVMEVSQDRESSYSRITLFSRKLESSLSSAAIVKRTARALDEQRPTAVCLNGYATPLALGALRWCVDNHVPTVMLSESTAWDESRKRWKEWIKSRVIRLCSSTLVGGTPHKDYMALLGMAPQRIFPGYDAVDNEYFARGAQMVRTRESELRQKHDLPQTYFMASARFVPKKNLPRLIEAFARYRQLASVNSKPWELVILGDGLEREAIAQQRLKLGLEKSVHLVGAKPYAELPIYYGLASAFIHASTTEQWGLVVNEAMASGLPVLISNRCGCAPDLVQEGINGFTFDPFDVDDIAQRMLRLASSTDQLPAFGLASQEGIAVWSPTRFADGLAHAVETAMSVPRPQPAWFDRLLLSILLHR